VIRFEYTTLRGPGRQGWLLVEHGDAEICEKHPGGDEDLVVLIHDPLAFARWHLGEIAWRDALRSGAIELTGRRDLARALPTWNRNAGQPQHGVHGAPVRSVGHRQVDTAVAATRR
jgi:hypothetical protein